MHEVCRHTLVRALICCLTAMVLPIALAPAAVAATEPSTIPRQELIPAWSDPVTGIGDREVWIQPVLPEGHLGYDGQELIDNMNESLEAFNRVSGGKLSMTANRVLTPHYFESQRSDFSTCSENVQGRSDASREVVGPRGTLPPSVHLVMVLPPSDCPFSGLAHTPGQEVTLFGLTDPPELGPEGRLGRTLLHELGHNLGLPHANSYPTLYNSEPWERHGLADDSPIDYGSSIDVMGLGPVDGYMFDALNRVALGWGDGIVAGPQDPGEHVVRVPDLDADGPDAVLVTDPATQERYVFTYLPNEGGVLIQKLNDRLERGQFWRFFSYGFIIAPRGGKSTWIPGWEFRNATGTLRAEVEQMDSGEATVRVVLNPDDDGADREAPRWKRKPKVKVSTNGKATITVHPALDLSGVVVHAAKATGRVQLLTYRANGDNVWADQYIIMNYTKKWRTTRFTITLTDPSGNVTTWERKIRVPPARR